MEVKTNTDLISVIIPVYNVEKYLVECVESVLNQTYKNLEIILVDDGSPDRCPEMCDEYARKDSRVKVIHKKNGGLSDARNAGIDVATGEYISFVDSDDYVSEDMIGVLYERAVQTQADLTFCSIEKVDENGKRISLENVGTSVYDRNEFWENKYYQQQSASTVAWNKLYKKHIFYKLRYAVGRIHEDDIILLKVIEKCNIIATVQQGRYMYRQRNDSIMHTEYTLAKFQLIEERLEMAEYHRRRGCPELSKKALYVALATLKRGYLELNLSESKIRMYYKKQIVRFKKVFKEISEKNLTLSEKIYFSIWFLLPVNRHIKKIVLLVARCF